MNADAFRHLYDYHFSQNRYLWDSYIVPLSPEHFVQPVAYSVGSIRDHLVHVISVDDSWFSALRGLDVPNMLDPAEFEDKATLRARWDGIEQDMRHYLNALTDAQLNDQPFSGEDQGVRVWQALLQVANHGTDHRAQLHRLLHDVGVKTVSQDYIFYVYDNPS